MKRDESIFIWIEGLNLVIGLCGHLLDEDYQERFWIQAKGPEWDSFYECSLKISYAFEDFFLTPEWERSFPKQAQIMEEFELYLDQVSVEHEDGLSRGGYGDQADDWLKLKKMARALVPELVKVLLLDNVYGVIKSRAGELNVDTWKLMVENPLCNFTSEQQEKLLALIVS